METTSLRSYRINSLQNLLHDVTLLDYLGSRAEGFAAAEYAAWRAACAGSDGRGAEERQAYVEAIAREIRAELARLREMDDMTYRAETAHLPLSYWDIPLNKIGPHAYERGIEGRPWYEPFDNIHHVEAGVWRWYRIGADDPLTYEELLPILGADLANRVIAPGCEGRPAPP